MRFARLSRCCWIPLCLTLVWVACGSSGGSSTQRSVTGQVSDAQSGRGIAQAAVELTSDALDHAETTTDAEGRFTLDVSVSEGILFGSVRARHRDYAEAPARTVYFDGEQNVVEIALRRKPGK